jgi:hypothetical protein
VCSVYSTDSSISFIVSNENSSFEIINCGVSDSILSKQPHKNNVAVDVFIIFPFCSIVVTVLSFGKHLPTIVLLSHFETLLYLTFDEKKVREINIRHVANNKIKKINELSSNDLGLLLAIAITEIVFARTDYFDNPENIDQRLPFRNNILHNGILSYSEADIDWVYKILLSFILKIMQIKNKFDKTQK